VTQGDAECGRRPGGVVVFDLDAAGGDLDADAMAVDLDRGLRPLLGPTFHA
jgi:hypothetical protein